MAEERQNETVRFPILITGDGTIRRFDEAEFAGWDEPDRTLGSAYWAKEIEEYGTRYRARLKNRMAAHEEQEDCA
jgi:hypothetical protein